MKGRDIVSVNLRMPPELHAELQRVAEEQDRSLTAQINRFLREAVERYRTRRPELGEEADRGE